MQGGGLGKQTSNWPWLGTRWWTERASAFRIPGPIPFGSSRWREQIVPISHCLSVMNKRWDKGGRENKAKSALFCLILVKCVPIGTLENRTNILTLQPRQPLLAWMVGWLVGLIDSSVNEVQLEHYSTRRRIQESMNESCHSILVGERFNEPHILLALNCTWIDGSICTREKNHGTKGPSKF